MRKILAFICCLMLVVCFAACGETQEAATETTTDSFNALAFDTKIIAQLTQADLELNSCFNELNELTDGFKVSEMAVTTGQNINAYIEKIKELTYPADNIQAKEYQAEAITYLSHIVVYMTYTSMLGLETEGYGISNPEATAKLDAEYVAEMQKLMDSNGNIDELSASFSRLIDNRKAFLLDCGEFEDEAAVDAYLAEYPYPVEY